MFGKKKEKVPLKDCLGKDAPRSTDAAFDKYLKKQKEKYGERLQLGDEISVSEIVPYDLPSVDYFSGIGGIMRGRMYEIYGAESSGKTTMCFNIIKQFQQTGDRVAYIDIERSFVPEWAKACGVMLANRMFVREEADNGDQALEIMRGMVEDKHYGLIVVDSVGMMSSKKEAEKNLDEVVMAGRAVLMDKALRLLNPDLGRTNTTSIWVNQIRYKIGGFGNPETTPGGMALKHAASVRMRVSRKSSTEDEHSIVDIKFDKNKLGVQPIGQATAKLNKYSGYVNTYGLGEVGVDTGVIEHKEGGKKYSFGNYVWVGLSAMEAAIEKDPKLVNEIKEAIYLAFKEKRVQFSNVAPQTIDEETGEIEPETTDLEEEDRS